MYSLVVRSLVPTHWVFKGTEKLGNDFILFTPDPYFLVDLLSLCDKVSAMSDPEEPIQYSAIVEPEFSVLSAFRPFPGFRKVEFPDEGIIHCDEVGDPDMFLVSHDYVIPEKSERDTAASRIIIRPDKVQFELQTFDGTLPIQSLPVPPVILPMTFDKEKSQPASAVRKSFAEATKRRSAGRPR